jgi:hypothetical protein
VHGLSEGRPEFVSAEEHIHGYQSVKEYLLFYFLVFLKFYSDNESACS